jgi:nucleoside-diphosphate-sugar epimerase
MSFDDPEPVLRDAIMGTLCALESANKEPSVKSFVLMSSIPRDDDYTFTEADWNTVAEDAVKKLGKATPGPVIYSASKVAAERALWKFRDEHKPKFTVTAINPWYVLTLPPGVGDGATLINSLAMLRAPLS